MEPAPVANRTLNLKILKIETLDVKTRVLGRQAIRRSRRRSWAG
jgi:hypothetical protein